MQLARRAGIRLKIAPKVDNADREYYHPKINDCERLQEIEFSGEIGDREKGAFFGAAIALLFPADWPESFHPMMTEAMANGWPVIGSRRDAVPEAIDVGVTGFLVDSVDGAFAALPHALALDRKRICFRFEQRFSVERMARGYAALYEGVLSSARGNALVLVSTTGQPARDAA